MKKYMALILAAITGFISFSGCSGTYGKGTSPGHIAKTLGPQIVEYINNNDAESLKKLFCEQAYDSYDLDKELQEAFNFINGTITSYRITLGSEAKSVQEGKIVKNNFSILIKDIETDTGYGYRIVINYHLVDDKHPELLGMQNFTIRDSNLNNPVTVGIKYDY